MTSVVDRRTLENEGIKDAQVHWNLSDAVLYEQAIRRQEGLLAAEGPLVCRTGHHTGRSPNDKFIVREPSSEQHVAWGGPNRPMSEEQFDRLHADMLASLRGAELFVQDVYAGADARYRLPVRVVTEYAWHSLFARNLFIVRRAPMDMCQS
ncbi:MAG: phosphoenolpyruvate carboxykinase (ATP) [Vicinamibacterales bacterium]